MTHRQRSLMYAVTAALTVVAFVTALVVARVIPFSTGVQNGTPASTVSLPPPWWHPFSDENEVFAAANRGEAWVLTTRERNRMSCGGGPTLMLFNHPDAPRPRMAADWAAPWPNPPAGGVWLREFSVKCPDAEPSPARTQASVEIAAAAAWAAGFAFQWRDACGRNRVAFSTSEIYTIPDDVPRKGQALTPDRALNVGCPK